MEDRATGISYAEFSYMVLQGFDFYHLRNTFNCELQIGATDQWGNITVGTELTRKKMGATVWGLVLPLMVKADGTKYGKTADGAVWLDPKKTSPYRFYQFFVNADDADVVKLLKMLTFLPEESIADLAARVAAKPEAREAQKVLAGEMTKLVHGEDAADSAEAASGILFGGSVADATEASFNDLAGEVPTSGIARAALEGAGTTVIDLLVTAGLAASKSESRRAVESGGVYLNNAKVDGVAASARTGDLLFGKYLLLRKGKRSYAILQVD
jgi:tyrosyl-tRNA synthetase